MKSRKSAFISKKLYNLIYVRNYFSQKYYQKYWLTRNFEKYFLFSWKKGMFLVLLGQMALEKPRHLKRFWELLSQLRARWEFLVRIHKIFLSKKRIGFMPENTYLYKYLTGDEFLDYAAGFLWYFQRKNRWTKKLGFKKSWIGRGSCAPTFDLF